jgi:pimeloyl-ACP methyl ester carboxylesterase
VLVLVHGAGQTSEAWDAVRDHLRSPSIAVDVPGRRNRPAALCAVTIEAAAASIVADVDAVTGGEVVLVGHSAGGALLPAIAARLGDRVEHLVFVAGLCAPEGARVIDVLGPGDEDEAVARAAHARDTYPNHMFRPDGVTGWAPLDDVRLALALDSFNLITQPLTWRGVPPVPRTFVRPRHDRVQPPELQRRFIEICGASTVIDVDTGHNPHEDAPAELATILDRVAAARPPALRER